MVAGLIDSGGVKRGGADVVVIAIGDELLNGAVVDSNSAVIGAALRSAGYRVAQAFTLPDNSVHIAAVLRHLAGDSAVVIVSGGLGPTRDDVTARAVAAAFHLPLTLNETALAQIEDFFRRRGRDMPPGNEKQALIPHKGKVMDNPVGSAPGFIVDRHHTLFFFLPGVPEEMAAMLQRHVLPLVRQRLPAADVLCERSYQLLGIAEAQLERTLAADEAFAGLEVSFRLQVPLVIVKLHAVSGDSSHLDRAERRLYQLFGAAVVARGDTSLVRSVAQLLRGADHTLAVAESCTGGLIAKLLTDVPGSSTFFCAGAVSYANEAKQYMLGVRAEVLEQHGAVSAECAHAMALGMRRNAGSDFALAVTGIAGPDGGSDDKPCGTVFIALAQASGVEVRRHHFSGSRERVRLSSAYTALNWLRVTLLQRAGQAEC